MHFGPWKKVWPKVNEDQGDLAGKLKLIKEKEEKEFEVSNWSADEDDAFFAHEDFALTNMLDESNKMTRMDKDNAVNHQTNFSMITKFSKELKEFQNRVSSLDSRLTEMDKTLRSHVAPPPRRMGGFDRTALRSQWKALLRLFGELLVATTFEIVAILIIEKFGFHKASPGLGSTK